MGYLSSKEERQLLGYVYDSMQAYYNDVKSFYTKPTRTANYAMSLVSSYAQQQQENPVYVLSSLFNYWTFLNKEHTSKVLKLLTPSSINKSLIEKAYTNDNRFSKTYLFNRRVFNRHSLLVQGAYSYFYGEKPDLESMQELARRDAYLYSSDPYLEPSQSKVRTKLLEQYSGHSSKLIQDGFLTQAGYLSMLDSELYALLAKDLVRPLGLFGHEDIDEPSDFIDIYFIRWLDYLKQRRRLIDFG